MANINVGETWEVTDELQAQILYEYHTVEKIFRVFPKGRTINIVSLYNHADTFNGYEHMTVPIHEIINHCKKIKESV